MKYLFNKSPFTLLVSLSILFLVACSIPQTSVEEIKPLASNTATQNIPTASAPVIKVGTQTNKPTNSNTYPQSCNRGTVTLTSDFAAGRMDECKEVRKNEYFITLVPENTPINSSPWYAFKIQAKKATEITITMKVRGDKHRYPPKISHDGKSWKLQEYKLKGERLIMKVKPMYSALILAARLRLPRHTGG
eukprot:TRINITY_DN16505_c0_g1_i1.p1 TRINITY_DN16505_c0_g1~~TRINITY_DN16505_c0_g1_i1.p1  ORF type:complete len:191 (+),score=55.14 TRINITY_DN16505_c0_g1_i1:82-654(+)